MSRIQSKLCHEITNEGQVIKLDLDQLVIKRLTEDDRVYLEKFNNLHKISMKSTKLRSLENLP